jgi:hypothetical protein
MFSPRVAGGVIFNLVRQDAGVKCIAAKAHLSAAGTDGNDG